MVFGQISHHRAVKSNQTGFFIKGQKQGCDIAVAHKNLWIGLNKVEIHPVEVEEVIYQRPEVSEAQVFGIPDPEKGQEVVAWVKLKEGSKLSLIELAAHVIDNLSEEKLPQYYKFVSDFPMTRSGKAQKFKMAEMAEKEREI